MSYKSYTRYLIIPLLIIFYISLIIWEFGGTKKALNGGDLARLGYFAAEQSSIEQPPTTTQKHIDMSDYILHVQDKKIDIVTIGDSFFNGGRGGQDYLSTEYNLTVLNINPMKGYAALEMAIILYNNGYLKQMAPRVVIIESVGRSCAYRFGNYINFTENRFMIPIDEINEYYLETKHLVKNKINYNEIFDSRLIKTNIKYIASLINYNLNKFKLNSLVYYDILKQPMFSNRNQENLLLYYNEDVKNHINKNQVGILNSNMNNFSAMLKKEKIDLMFMIAVDKWDLYYNYIENPKYPPNPLFDYMRELDKNYIFIDTKKILSQELEKGVRDIYWLDDTHWSWKGQFVTATNIIKELKNI